MRLTECADALKAHGYDAAVIVDVINQGPNEADKYTRAFLTYPPEQVADINRQAGIAHSRRVTA